MSFYQKYLSITKKNDSYVCVGLDTDHSKIPSCLNKEENPTLVFNKKIIDETYKYTACYKPNFAFYLSQGIKGIETLKATIEHIPPEIPVIIDIKAGDIGNTMEQYAKACFEYFAADAITINILMGSDVIEAYLKCENSFAFALALTSNPSTNDFFQHNELYAKLAMKIAETDHERLGAVVGATQTSDLLTLRKILPQTLFLVPGVGAQGGDLKVVCQLAKYKSDDARFLINSSRGIIFADDTKNFHKTAAKETKKLQRQINQMLKK